MRAVGEKLVATFHPDKFRPGWVAFLTWRLGFRGVGELQTSTETEMRDRLKSLDPIVIFSRRGDSIFDEPGNDDGG